MMVVHGADASRHASHDAARVAFRAGAWHVGLFIVATAPHGRGAAHALYAALEAWMRASGAAWIRLGVVAGNARAERFWRRVGYVETRVRAGVAMGERVNAVRVLARPASTRHAR